MRNIPERKKEQMKEGGRKEWKEGRKEGEEEEKEGRERERKEEKEKERKLTCTLQADLCHKRQSQFFNQMNEQKSGEPWLLWFSGLSASL